MLLGALAVMTVAFALMPLIRTAWEAFAIYTLWGIGSGSFWPSQSALLAGLTPAARRAPAYALQRLAMNVGVALGGVVAGLIASVGHPETFTVLFAINCVTFVGYMVVLARVRAPALHEGGSAAAGAPCCATASSRCYTLLNAAFMTAAISLVVELLPAFAQERDRDQREGGRHRVRARRDRSRPLPAPGREARRRDGAGCAASR